MFGRISTRRLAMVATLPPLLALGMGLRVSGANPPPPMTFTPNTRADIGEGDATGQSEPMLAVDEFGQTYLSWASGAGPYGMSRTTDGVNFTYLGTPSNNLSPAGDVVMTTSSWPSATETRTPQPGVSGVVWSALGSGCAAIEIVATTSTDFGVTNSPSNAGCVPGQVDRPWVAAYTDPQYRGTTDAMAHTWVYEYFHTFDPLEYVYVVRSSDGGQTWDPVNYPAMELGSPQMLTTTCNTTPGNIAVDQRGAHPGRIWVTWATSDMPPNFSQGCNYTQAQAFDHFFFSYSDDNGVTWKSGTIFNDPCAPSPPVPPLDASQCNDVAAFWQSLAVDDAGDAYAAFPWRDPASPNPEYSIYLSHATSTASGVTFDAPVKASVRTGTHYSPWVVAGAAGMVDVVDYATDYVEGLGMFNKPAAAPPEAEWNVYLSQSLDGGKTFTESKVTDHPNYFGNYCTTGIFCGIAPSQFNWGQTRILYENFGVGIGPDGGARVVWTDTRDSWSAECFPNPDADNGCQNSHAYFACQVSGTGLHGETVTGCGQSTPAAVAAPSEPPAADVQIPNTSTPSPLAGIAALTLAAFLLVWRGVPRRRSRR